MNKEHKSLRDLHNDYIAGSVNKAYVTLDTFCITSIRKEVKHTIDSSTTKTYISTKVLKHIYDRHFSDKKQEKIYFFIIDNLHRILKYPEIVRVDKESRKKKGRIVFLKRFEEDQYACTIEKTTQRKGKKLEEVLNVVTVFKTKKGGKYLSETTILYKKN